MFRKLTLRRRYEIPSAPLASGNGDALKTVYRTQYDRNDTRNDTTRYPHLLLSLLVTIDEPRPHITVLIYLLCRNNKAH
jgi:hypothetical protein